MGNKCRQCLCPAASVFFAALCELVKSLAGRQRDALAAGGTRRESSLGGAMAASMPPSGPQSARAPRPDSQLATN
ncbi:hypothetical protein XAB3213_1010016 [Xanthomonas citri pv. bilvae]|nr:hypothetical protein XAB3213_1010016 [Xanthomonas citri pv. bilvae]